MDFERDLAIAHEVASAASRIAMAFFATGVNATRKADGSPVTEADLAVEQLLRSEYGRRLPEDALLGEEFGEVGSSSRVWILDPIDGTAFFARSDPNWRIHLALQVEGRIQVAVVAAPALNLRWWAIRGGGAFEARWIDGPTAAQRLHVTKDETSVRTRIACLPESLSARLPVDCVGLNLNALPLIDLVRGEIDAVVAEGFEIWDHAPWTLLVEEAGGRFTDRTGGSSPAHRGGVYSNVRLHDELVHALRYRESNHL